jgi:hypothetical protein
MTIKTILLSIAMLILVGCNSGGGRGNGKGNNGNSSAMQATVTDALNAEKSILTQELKDSITYMYNEEKLAKEVYLNVNNEQPVKQLYNIATNAEINHEQAVNDLAVKYDLNITLYPDTVEPYDQNSVDQYGNGQFAVVAIQELYDILYDKGIQSQKDALEVGCMVEVTDIDDLDNYMQQATDANAEDVLAIFDYLREGSYNHYWSFNQGLNDMGISDGCCSLGTEYCHLEYPQ